MGPCCLSAQVPFHAAATMCAAGDPAVGEPDPLLHTAAVYVLRAILQSAHSAGLFKFQLAAQDTSSTLAVSMLQQLQDAGLMQQLPVLLWSATEDLRDALAIPARGSLMLHAFLDRAADMLSITEHVILLHRALPAVLQAHALLAPAGFALIAVAMQYLSVHLPALHQQQQQQQQQQPGMQTAQRVLLLKGTEVVLAAEQLVATLGKPVLAFGGISAALRAVPQLQQLLDSPDLVPFLVLQLAVVSQGLLVQQPLQELHATAAAKECGSRKGRQCTRGRSDSGGNASNPSSSSSGSTSATIGGEQPLVELQQQQAQQQLLPPTTPCQQRLFELLGVDSITLAWAGHQQRVPHSTMYFQGLLRLYREVVTVKQQQQEEGEDEEDEQDEGAATQWQLHLLLPGVLLPCAARLCKHGSAAAAALGLSMADQALLCRNIARASIASLHVWDAQCGVAGGSRCCSCGSSSSSTLHELQLRMDELRSLSLLVLQEVLLAMPQQQQQEKPQLRLVSVDPPADATPAKVAAAAAAFAKLSAGCAGSTLAPSADAFADAAVPALAAPAVEGASTPQLPGCEGCRLLAEVADPQDDCMHAAGNLIGALQLLLSEQGELDALVQQQDKTAEETQQQQQQADVAPAGPGEDGSSCCSATAAQQHQQQHQCSGQVGAASRGVHRDLPHVLSVPAQLPFLCATFERLVRMGAAAITAKGLDAYTMATQMALSGVGACCSGPQVTPQKGVLTAAVQEAGLGQAGGRQFYSLMCSLVKLCYCFSKQSVLQNGLMWSPIQAAGAAMHAMHLEEGENSVSAPTLDALPSVFIIGRCCLLWADILSARGEDGQLALQECEQLELRCFLHEYLTALCFVAAAWLAARSAHLPAAGYPNPSGWLQQLHAAASKAAAAAQQAEAEAVAAQCAVLVQELRALGGASCLFAVPLFCNNPRCMSLHGETEVSLVSGRACVCSGCRVARYCGRECLRQHWKQHKPVCKALAAAAAAVPDGAAASAPGML